MQRRLSILFVVGCLMGGLVGCESDGDGGGSLGDGHDFGENSRDVYTAVGDSITRGYGASVPYPAVLSSMLGKRVVNRGVNGATTGEGLSSVGSALSNDKPGFLLILFGANDVIRSNDPAMVIEQLRGIIQAAKNNKTIPVLATLTPQVTGHAAFAGGVISLNARIRTLAAEEGVELVDLESAFTGHNEYLQSDGLHPNNTGLSVMAAEFFDVVK